MTASRANPGFGVQFQVGDGGSPETFATMAEVLSVSGVGTTHRTAEVTHMTSPDGWAEHIGLGVKEGKAFTLGLNFVADDAAQVALYQTRVESGGRHNYRVIFTDAGDSQMTFEAIITDTTIGHERDAAADMSISILPSGGFTWA